MITPWHSLGRSSPWKGPTFNAFTTQQYTKAKTIDSPSWLLLQKSIPRPYLLLRKLEYKKFKLYSGIEMPNLRVNVLIFVCMYVKLYNLEFAQIQYFHGAGINCF